MEVLAAKLELWHGLIVFVGGIIAVGVQYQKLVGRLEKVEEDTKPIEKLRDDMTEVKTDVRWIREKLR